MRVRPTWRTAADLVLAALIIGVIWQNQRVVRRSNALEMTIRAVTGNALQAGDRLPPLLGVDPKGQRTIVDLRTLEKGALIYTFSSGCPACQQSLEPWRRLASMSSTAGLETICVSKNWWTTLHAFILSAGPPPGKLLTDPAYGTYVGLRMDSVPYTALATRESTVLKVWRGLITPEKEDEIRAYIRSIDGFAR